MDAAQEFKGQKSPKDEAINKIVLGVVLKFGLTGLLGLALEASPESFQESPWYGLLSFVILCLFIQGCIFFVRGTLEYALSKGWHSRWGWLGLCSFLGLALLTLLPVRQSAIAQNSVQSEKDPFRRLNLVESCLIPVFSVVSIYIFLAWLVGLVIGSSFEQVDEFLSVPGSVLDNLFLLILPASYYALVVKEFHQSKIRFSALFGSFEKVDLTQVIWLIVAKFCFAISSWRIGLYSISFFVPTYTERVITEEKFTDVPSLILWAISGVIIAPLFEELIFRGVLTHKWASKWGVTPGLIASSILFALIHFRFDLIYLSIAGLSYSFLYIKSGSLWLPIFCHAAHNLCATGLMVLSQLSSPDVAYNSTEELVQAYQLTIQSGFWWILPMFCASGASLGYWLWKMKPNANSELPYFANESRSLNEPAHN